MPTTWYNMNDDESDDMILGIPYGSDVNGACMLPNFDKVQESFDTVDYDTFTDLYPGIYADGVTAKVNKQTTGNVTFDAMLLATIAMMGSFGPVNCIVKPVKQFKPDISKWRKSVILTRRRTNGRRIRRRS